MVINQPLPFLGFRDRASTIAVDLAARLALLCHLVVRILMIKP